MRQGMLPYYWRRRLALFLLPVVKNSNHCIWPKLVLSEKRASVSETLVLF